METTLSVDTRLRNIYGHPNVRSTCIRLTLENPGPFSLSCSIGWDMAEQFNQAAAIMGYPQAEPRNHCYSFVLVVPRMVPAGFCLTAAHLNGLDVVHMRPYSLVYMSRRTKISALAREVDSSVLEPDISPIVDYMQKRLQSLFYWVDWA